MAWECRFETTTFLIAHNKYKPWMLHRPLRQRIRSRSTLPWHPGRSRRHTAAPTAASATGTGAAAPEGRRIIPEQQGFFIIPLVLIILVIAGGSYLILNKSGAATTSIRLRPLPLRRVTAASTIVSARRSERARVRTLPMPEQGADTRACSMTRRPPLSMQGSTSARC